MNLWLLKICVDVEQILSLSKEFLLFDYTGWVSFRKTLHACGINEKAHILVDLGQFEDKVLLNSMQVLKVFTCENAK